MNESSTPTVWVVWCSAHTHYLKFVSVTGTTWCDDQDEAKVYKTKPAARTAAEKATWLDHNPTPWAIAGKEN